MTRINRIVTFKIKMYQTKAVTLMANQFDASPLHADMALRAIRCTVKGGRAA